MWIILSFLTAVCEAAKDGLCKKSLRDLDVFTISWVWKVFSLPFIVPLIILAPVPEHLPKEFWVALVVGGGLNILATLLYIRAINLSDLSITLPLLSFTPVFLLFTSPLMVGDVPSAQGYAGVFFIFCGSYLLGIKDRSSLFSPLLAIVKEPGARLMLGVALIWSVAANMDKIGVTATSPFFWAVCVQGFISLGLTLILLMNRSSLKGRIRSNMPVLLLIGLVTGAGFVFQMWAIKIGLVPYVIAIKRTSIILGVLIGGLYFLEQDLKTRIWAATVMLAGVFLIALS
ncbi:EamA family transporter [Desulfonatronovibrio hydrogenovorans]|uniref:EamA family transporter n=1 Tax=Desulfonatronovibrio hydrogenovorans TaxID=53245 RepID=UPI00048F2625|nr:DMT family transporter [Desulfonatronovibrio hydrogenovorans]